MNIKDIVIYINRKIGDFENEITEYRNKMDQCECFSKKYWQYHDRYEVAFIKKSCLAELLGFIRGESYEGMVDMD